VTGGSDIGSAFARFASEPGVRDAIVANPAAFVILLGLLAILVIDLLLGAPWWALTSIQTMIAGARASRARALAVSLREEAGPRFAVLLGSIRRDRHGELKDLVSRGLGGPLKGFLFDRDVLIRGAPIDLRGAMDPDAARDWIKRFEADLMIWGDAGGAKSTLQRLYFLTRGEEGEEPPIQEIRLEPPTDLTESQRLSAGLAYIFARTALPLAHESDRYRIDKLQPVLDALGALAHEPPKGLGPAFEQVLRRDASALALSIGRRQQDAGELRRASRLRVRILAEIDRAAEPVEWALARADLGRVQLALGRLELDDKRLAAAAEAFQDAVEGLQAPENREGRARALLDLARAEHERAQLGEPAPHYAEAAKAYRSALRAAPEDDQRFLDDGRRGLAASLHALADIDGDQGALRQAVEAYRDARTERLRAVDAPGWALVCHRLGDALTALAARHGDPTLYEEAVASYEEALRERSRDTLPKEWAETHAQLGLALIGLGKSKPDLEALQHAAEAFRKAMKEISAEDDPERWSHLQNNLGNASQALGEATGDRRHLVTAVTAYRTAIEHIDRRAEPFMWAGVQNNLGNALHALGEKSQGVEALEAALTAHRNALTVRTKERSRVDWAATRNNMGLVLTTLGARLRDPQRLEEAIGAYRDALGVFRMAGEVRFAVMAERNLDRAKALLDESRQMAAE
jgi:tetratricopeptide (TPR) repeat protein